jgi:2-polyprenyl-3-methyl-5-hydroxy-6-metoxy-1,4-benzoquinol methylase
MAEKTREIEVTGFETMASAMEFVDNYNNWILGKFKPYTGKKFLEIGTGQGNFKKMLAPGADSYVSIDIDKEVIERAAGRDPGGTYIVADAAAPDLVTKLSTYEIDTVICVNVLEHIPDHKSALNNMINVMKPGGHLLLFSPAFMHLYNDLDKLAGHVRRYRKREILELVKENKGCEVVVNEYFNPIGAFGWWLNKFTTHKNINSRNVNKQVMFFDRYVVPVSKLLNGMTKHVWGQSVYCVIRKK